MNVAEHHPRAELGLQELGEGRGLSPHLAPHEETEIAAKRLLEPQRAAAELSTRQQLSLTCCPRAGATRSHQAALVPRWLNPDLQEKGI